MNSEFKLKEIADKVEGIAGGLSRIRAFDGDSMDRFIAEVNKFEQELKRSENILANIKKGTYRPAESY